LSLLPQGNAQIRVKADSRTKRWRKIGLRTGIGNMERAMVAYPAKMWPINALLHVRNSYWTKMSPQNRIIPLVESQHHIIDPANPGRALDDGVEHRLHIRRRAADNTEHLSRCRLMLQGLAQLRIALLQFFEQPDILNGDHRLISERF